MAMACFAPCVCVTATCNVGRGNIISFSPIVRPWISCARRVPCWNRNWRNSRADCVVKIVVSRGEGGRGYGVPDSVSPNRVVLAAPAPNYPEHFWHAGVKLHVCDMRICHQPRLAGIKHLNRLENVLARMEWDDPGTPEGLLLDAEGWVVEGTMSNLFMRQGKILRTPDLSACGVAGLQRERILNYAAQLDLTPEITQFSLPILLAADEVFICNSVIGVWPVKQIGTQPIALGPIAIHLQHLLESETD
jgi:4-amino-4-deoxychorismate lyase